MSAGSIRQGGVFVEIGADARQFFATLNKVNKQIGKIGATMSSAGSRMMGVGAGLAAPFAASAVAGARFQDVLLNVRASTGATAAELDLVRKAAMAMSQSLGVGPSEAASGFLELLKAGMSVEQVLGGAGEAALSFAKVGGMATADAAVVMADAMNVFKVSGETAANTLSAAADASSTSIEGMALAFSQVSAVAALANQSIGDTAAALAVLANAGVKGSDAGTSLKTMLMRLMAPADDAAVAMQELGLSTQSFRNADGTMKPMVEIIRTLTTAMQGMDQAAKDDIFRRIFGQDAIRAAAVLTQAGVEGFEAMQGGMAGAMTVGDKFATMSSGLSGAASTLKAALERLAIAVSDAVGPAIMSMAQAIQPVIDGFAKFVSANQELVGQVAKGVAVFTAAGAALFVFGKSLSLVSGVLGLLGSAISTAAAPLRLVVASVSGIGSAFASVVPGVFSLGAAMVKASSGFIVFATQAGASAAAYVASLATMTAATAARMGFVAATWVATGIAVSAGFIAHIKAMITYYTGALASIQAITISRMGATAAAWISSSVGAGTFADATKAALATSNRAVSATVAAIGPAISFVSRGVAAIASDAARLAAPLTTPFVSAGKAVSGFAVSAATGIGSYITSVASAVASTVVANAQIAAAWIGGAARAVAAFVAQAATAMGAYIAPVIGAVTTTVASAAAIAGAWLATAFPATAAFVSGAVASLATYIASTAAALAASVTSAVGVAAAWVTSGMPGLAAFVGSAIAGIASYIGSCAAAVASSVASAAAVAAAWLAPLAPFALLAAAIGGAAALAYSFSGSIKGAFSGLGDMVGQAGAAIGGVFSQAVSDATVVFGDLYKTATTTFSGVYDAIANGDLSGAMDVLWAGLQAGWLRGVEALMGVVDPWVSMFQNTFTVLGAEIYKVWDTIWLNVSSSFNTFGAVLQGAFDNVINTVMAAWDTLESGIRKSWNYVQSFFKKGFDLKKENEKVDSEMTARARKRELERPGVEGRTKKAAEQNARATKERDDRAKAVDANTEATIAGREEANRQRAEERRAATQAAEGRVVGLSRAQSERRVFGAQADEAIGRLESASTMEQIQEIAQEFHALAATGRLTEEQMKRYGDAVEAAQDRVETARGEAGATADGSTPVDPEKLRKAAAEAAASQAEVAGTFSAQAVSGMGFGQSLAQKQLDELKGIHQELKKDTADKVAA